MSKNPEYKTKDGDTPTIAETITDRLGTPVSLPVGATVEFVLWRITPSETAATTSTGTLVDAATGQVSYTLTTAQTALDAGTETSWTFGWEFRVTDTGYQLTAPAEGWGSLVVNPAGDT